MSQWLISRRPSWRVAFVALPLLLLLAGCGTSAGPQRTITTTPAPTVSSVVVGATVDLAPASFVQETATLHVGEALRFNDPAATGGPHMLCLGHNQICAATANGPTLLRDPGFRILAGDPARSITFDAPGTYQITCTFHPLMNLAVTVN